ncbi:hypothetical protein TNCV_3853471 [Trichonephila clavipes]|nr:hypothetical protein TNCV_3853471 [Trichonephila clavipes]
MVFGMVSEENKTVVIKKRGQTHCLDEEIAFVWKETLDHPPSIPELAPRDFHLFEIFKKLLGGHHFKTNAEVQQSVSMLLHNFEANFYDADFNGLVYR